MSTVRVRRRPGRGTFPRRSTRAGTYRYIDSGRFTLSRTDSPRTEKGWGQIPARVWVLAIVPEGPRLTCPSGGRLGRHSSRAADRTPGGHEFPTIYIYEVCSKSIQPLFIKNTRIQIQQTYTNLLQSSPLGLPHFSQRFCHCRKQRWNASFGMARSWSVAFRMMSSLD